jgi:hypothetical protein
MESKALALGKQVKAEALNSNVHLLSVTLKVSFALALPLHSTLHSTFNPLRSWLDESWNGGQAGR